MPAGKAGREVDVLTAGADGAGEVVLLDREIHAVLDLVNPDAEHDSGLHGVHHILNRIVIPLYEIDLLAAELVLDRGDAALLHADAGADGVNPLVLREERDLGSPCLGHAGNRLDLDEVLPDLRDLLPHDLGQELRIGPREGEPGALPVQRVIADVEEETGDVVAHAEERGLAGKELACGQDRLGAEGSRHAGTRGNAAADLDDEAVMVLALHDAGDDVADHRTVLLDDLHALRLADLLLQELPGGLHGDAVVRLDLDLVLDVLARLYVRVLEPRGLERHLHGRMREGAVVLDNLPAAVGLVLAGPAVDLGTHRNLDAVLGLVLLLGGERYGVLNRLEHLLLGQALLV